nr:AraC family transcriptional regulator [Caballeronia humi]
MHHFSAARGTHRPLSPCYPGKLLGLPRRRSGCCRADAGEFVVVPRGQAHLIGSSREAVQESAGNLPICPGLAPGEPVKLGHSGRTAQTRLICGFFACHDTLMNPVLLGLPCIFKADLRNDPHSPWFEWTLGLAAAEAAEWSAGSAVMLARLSELLFVAAVRGFIDALPTDRKGWLAGVGDRFVGLALAILHGKPAHGWTIEQLAQKTGLSPAALVQRFTHLLGEPPLQYLARLRVEIAAQKLANDTVAVGRDDAGRL